MDPDFLDGLKCALKKPEFPLKKTVLTKHKDGSMVKLKKAAIKNIKKRKSGNKKDNLISDIQASM